MSKQKRMIMSFLGAGAIVAGVALANSAITGTSPTTRAQCAEWANLAKISLEEAKQIALRATPGVVKEAELEMENGFLVYEVEIRDEAGVEHELLIDAGTGAILQNEVET